MAQNTKCHATIPRLAFTLAEFAQAIGVSYITAWRLVKRGEVRSSTALRTKVIPVTEVERWLKSTLEVS